jgi:hypothetical protein
VLASLTRTRSASGWRRSSGIASACCQASRASRPASAQAADLPETLAAGFDAFEAVRMTARDYQDRVPGLFPAFMTTADAAVDGREALTIAPSLPSPTAPSPAMRCRRARMWVRRPMPWPRSRPRSAIASGMPPERLPFPARSPLEDMHYSFILGSRGLPMIAVPSLDSAEVPDSVTAQLQQAARWFFGPARFARYLKDPATLRGWRARAMAASAFGLRENGSPAP